jgi:transcriptional regulator GlxA family with amidase domain
VKKRSIRRLLRLQDWWHLPAELGYHAYDLCPLWNVERKTLSRAFREELHVSPQRLFGQFRDLKAKALAQNGVRKKDIVQLLGYKHAAHLSRCLRRTTSEALVLLENNIEVIHNSVPES